MRARDRLAKVFPDLAAGDLGRLARRSRRQRGALHAAETKALALGERELCRLLHLEGWEHLHAAGGNGEGRLLLLPAFGAPALARRALGLYLPGLRWLDGEPEGAVELLRQGGILGCDFGGFDPAAGRGSDRSEVTLAREAGASLLPTLCLPFSQGRFHLAFHAPIRPGRSEEPATVRLFGWLESMVRAHPELWDWA